MTPRHRPKTLGSAAGLLGPALDWVFAVLAAIERRVREAAG